jgi:hypothetical protein
VGCQVTKGYQVDDSGSASFAEQLNLFPLPVPANIDPRPLTKEESIRIDTLSQLQFVGDASSIFER